MKYRSTYEAVLPCLKQGTPIQSNFNYDDAAVERIVRMWRYPDDADDHYNFLLSATEPYRLLSNHCEDDFCGPWIEDWWISNYLTKPLSFFNGFIPLFIQWFDFQLCCDGLDNIYETLKSKLRHDAIYITVSNSYRGIGEKFAYKYPNILVLSAGGFGHVPIPLIKYELILPAHQTFATTNSIFDVIKYDIGFFGSKWSPTKGVYKTMNIRVRDLNLTFFNPSDITTIDWKNEMQNVAFNLVQQDYGRTSLTLSHGIQLGIPPIFIYENNITWIPYRGTDADVENYGFLADSSTGRKSSSLSSSLPTTIGTSKKTDLKEILFQIQNMLHNQTSMPYINERYIKFRERVKEIRKLYTYNGVLEQIGLFIQTPFSKEKTASRLRCITHPQTKDS